MNVQPTLHTSFPLEKGSNHQNMVKKWTNRVTQIINGLWSQRMRSKRDAKVGLSSMIVTHYFPQELEKELKMVSELAALRLTVNEKKLCTWAPVTRTSNSGSIKFWGRSIVSVDPFENQKPTHVSRLTLNEYSGKIKLLLEHLVSGDQKDLMMAWDKFTSPNQILYIPKEEVEAWVETFCRSLPFDQKTNETIKHIFGRAPTNCSAFKNTLLTLFQPSFIDGHATVGPRACTKGGVEAIREIGIARLLHRTGLSDHVISGIGHTKGNQRLFLMQELEFKEMDGNAPLSPSAKVSLQMKGLIEALLHCQDGKWGNVTNITDSSGENQVRAFDLGKSLIPAKTIKSINLNRTDATIFALAGQEPTLQITLCSSLFGHSLMDETLPESLLELFQTTTFVDNCSLSGILEKTDPLRIDSKLFAEANVLLQKRAETLHQLAKQGTPITLRDVFEKLYPDEMKLIDGAEKLGLSNLHTVYAEEVTGKALLKPKLFSADELSKLEAAQERLKQNEMPLETYLPLWTND